MSLLDRIAEANNADLAAFVPFIVDGWRAGALRPVVAARLLGWPEMFVRQGEGMGLGPGLAGAVPAVRTRALEAVTRSLHAEGIVTGWRDELFPVAEHFAAPPAFLVERAAVSVLGVRGYGVHVNGFVREGDAWHMWIGHRSATKPTWPGRLDQMVGGGLAAGFSALETVVKECAEEADVPPALARTARAAGALTYQMLTEQGLRPDTVFVFDLELPPDFEPRNRDGEVARFERLAMHEVLERVRDTADFKTNCALVVIDFLLRHGFIGPDDRGYEALLTALHGPWRGRVDG